MLRSFRLSYDRDYGIDCRTGWSVAINGSVYRQLRPWLVAALLGSLWDWCRYWWKDPEFREIWRES